MCVYVGLLSTRRSQGLVTTAAAAGVGDDVLQRLGRWRSGAYEGYVRGQRHTVTAALLAVARHHRTRPPTGRAGHRRATARRLDTRRLDTRRLDTRRRDTRRLDTRRLGTRRLDTRRLDTRRLGTRRLGTRRLDARRTGPSRGISPEAWRLLAGASRWRCLRSARDSAGWSRIA
ncbi:Salivary glue protein Sgs-3 [Amphibalanus amphitrite]|uniref:Salivary glue protein Sgs-3 n=1 Tax=Amphibalanus amphitrite TaxID=1232801 RepID=A0A6A4WSZ8_AMPAM|nr:Salivary glue protein Sgs-3 [Amphibalanus amphitrite]